jgi:hypothetical protein
VTDEEALAQAVAAAEAEVAALEAELAESARKRHALCAEALAKEWARHDELTRRLLALSVEEQALRTEQAALEGQLERSLFRLPESLASPLSWYLRATAFILYGGSVVMAHRFLHSPGLALALLLGLPIAFVLAMVAGSLRESRTAEPVGGGTGQGEGPARVAAVDERVAAPPGGPGGDHEAGGGVVPPREPDRRDD